MRACSRVVEAFAAEELFLEAGEERLGERVVPGVADRAHREVDPGLLGVGAVAEARVLRAVIGVGDQPPSRRAARGDGHAERVEHELGLQVVAHRPADDAAAEDVLDGGEEQEALPGLDVLEVADPQPVGLAPGEAPVDEVRRRRALGVAVVVRGPPRRPSAPRRPSSRINRATRLRADALAVGEPQLRVDAWRAVDPRTRRRRSGGSARRAAHPRRRAAGLAPPPGVEALAGHPDRLAEQGDRELCGLLGDEPKPCHGRSLSLAKKAAARFRISRSCRSTRFSRSSSRNRARSSVVSTSRPLTAIGLVLTLPVTQRLRRTPQLARRAPSASDPAPQQPHRLLPKLRRIRRPRPPHHSAPLSRPHPGRITVSTTAGQLRPLPAPRASGGLHRVGLGVVPLEVASAAAGWPVCEGAVGALLVVVVEPVWQRELAVAA